MARLFDLHLQTSTIALPVPDADRLIYFVTDFVFRAGLAADKAGRNDSVPLRLVDTFSFRICENNHRGRVRAEEGTGNSVKS